MLGLKSFKTQFPRYRILKNFCSLLTEIKYAWQRAWRGYDDIALWNMNDFLDIILYEFIRFYKNDGVGYPMFYNDSKKSEMKWDQILDTLWDKLKFINVDPWDAYYTDEDYGKEHVNHVLEIERLQSIARREVYAILSIYIDCFWD